WEGVIGWAYRGAQRFLWKSESFASDAPGVRVGPAALLHTYLTPSVLSANAHTLEDAPHHLNLITIKRELELPKRFARLSAVWPGPIFELKPDYQGTSAADSQSISQCRSLAAGIALADATDRSPLSVLSWARTTYAQLMANPVVNWGDLLKSND